MSEILVIILDTSDLKVSESHAIVVASFLGNIFFRVQYKLLENKGSIVLPERIPLLTAAQRWYGGWTAQCGEVREEFLIHKRRNRIPRIPASAVGILM